MQTDYLSELGTKLLRVLLEQRRLRIIMRGVVDQSQQSLQRLHALPDGTRGDRKGSHGALTEGTLRTEASLED